MCKAKGRALSSAIAPDGGLESRQPTRLVVFGPAAGRRVALMGIAVLLWCPHKWVVLGRAL